jgi:hypothetical protein
MGMMFGPDEKVLTRGKMFAPAIPTPSHHGRAPGGRDGICIACHCLLLAVLMPRRFNVSAAACAERCAVASFLGMIPRGKHPDGGHELAPALHRASGEEAHYRI